MDRASARPLSRASSAVLNTKAGTGAGSGKRSTAKKRKRAEREPEGSASASLSASVGQDWDREWIVIKKPTRDAPGQHQLSYAYHQQSSGQQPDLELRACQTVSRLQLPLIYVDTAPHPDTYPRLFRGRVRALEDAPLENDLLIAEDSTAGRLFAIEKVQGGVFALCRLQSWVTLTEFGHTVKMRCTDTRREPYAKIERWWEPTSPPKSTTATAGSEELIGLRRRFTMKPRSIRNHAECESEQPTASIDEPTPQLEETTSFQIPVETTVDQDNVSSAAELLAAIKTHYLDSLYIYRTPLAYFVKGPLSRARGGVRQGATPSLQYQELIDFLRSHVMTLTMGTKKYDESLGEVIREIPVEMSPDEVDAQVTTPLKDRIRKSKKRKQLSKGGLLPGEEDYIMRWWVKREATSEYCGEDDTREMRIKTGLADQRARETQLQIILILEALALEAVAAREVPENAALDLTLEAEDVAKKKKKPIDLNNILDVLIDRLCIWESMNLDAPKTSKAQSSDAGKKTKANPKEPESDCLRDFCTDIVVPYYATRLPELYVSICQKLGGPSLTSSPPVMRTPAPKKMVKPGAAVTRAPPGRDKKTTQESTISKRPPAPLARSATDSQLPSLKQELSQVDLSQVPRHRPSLQQSRRYSQREVDLTAVAAATEVKLARKTAAEQELKSAIAALRKPNARLAVKDFVDSAEQHAAARASKSRKSKQPTRNPFATAVQVTATPKVNRQNRDRTAYTLPPPAPVVTHAHATTQSAFSEAVPPSSASRVPSSSAKPANATTHALFGPTQTPLPQRYVTAANLAVDATPSRKRAKVVPARRPSTSLTSGVPEVVPEVVVAAANLRADLGSSPQLPPPLQRTPEAAFKRPQGPVGPESAARPIEQRQTQPQRKQVALDLFCTPVKATAAAAAARRVAFAADADVLGGYGAVQEGGGNGTHIVDNSGEDSDDEDLDVVQLVSSTPAKATDKGLGWMGVSASTATVASVPAPYKQTDTTDVPSIEINTKPAPIAPAGPGQPQPPPNTTQKDDVRTDADADADADPVMEPEPESEPARAEPENIYALLGWDDEGDDF